MPQVRHSLAALADQYEPGLVSIIIPCYNNVPYVAEAIQSALDQSYHPCEVIVIDDGSTDGSWDLIQAFGDRIISRRRNVNGGACAARNDGLELARGAYIQFLDADDKLFPSAVTFRIDGQGSESTATYGNWVNIDEYGDQFDDGMQGPTTNISNLTAHLDNWLFTAAPLHVRYPIYYICGFDEKLEAGQESDLHLRLHIIGCRFSYIPIIVAQYRQHNSATRISVARTRHFPGNPAHVIPRVNYLSGLVRASATDAEIRRYEQHLSCKQFYFGRLAAMQGNRPLAESHFAAAELISDRTPGPLCRQKMWILGDILGRYRAERWRLAVRRIIRKPCQLISN